MKRNLISILLLFFPLLCAVAQDYTVELQPDKKVIYVNRLGLPENTPVIEVLRLIPELTVREGDEFLSGYDLFLDSKSLGYNKDVLLSTMKLSEVEKIEISTSATASQQINGMAGSIKIVSSSMSDGLSGTVTANANTLWTVYPNLNLNYRTDKLEVRGNVGLEYYSGKTTNYFEQVMPINKDVGNNTITEKYFQETARLHLKYNPTKKDQLKLWVLESLGLDDMNTFTEGLYTVKVPEFGDDVYRVTKDKTNDPRKTSKVNFSAFAEYEHVFHDEMKLTVSADYTLDNNREGTVSVKGMSPERPQKIQSEAKIVFPFLPVGKRSLNLTLGGNTTFGINDREQVHNRTFYGSPFMELKYKSPKLQVFTGVRFQYNDLVYDKSDKGLFENGNKDITFNVNALWQMKEHQAFRFLVTRNIIRPSADQLYPAMEFDLSRRMFVRGNKDLRPASMYSFELDYIADWIIDRHSFIANLSLGYDRSDGLVNMVQRFDEECQQFYMTYANTGNNDIMKAKGNLIYKYGIFSLSLAGNWYHNIKKVDGKMDNIDNFNVALSPIFSFNNDWTLSGTLRYNNAVISNDSRIGECLYSYLRLSKTFGKWIVSAMLSDIFGYDSENFEYKDGGYIYTRYDQYPRSFEIGVTYRIGR